MSVKKKKKPSVSKGGSKKLSKKELIMKQKAKLDERGGKSDMFYISKPGTYRMRSVPVHEDQPNGFEITQFYLGPEIKGVISPSCVGMPCALEEYYQEMKDSDDEDEQEIASNMGRRKRFVMPHFRYKDEKGKQPDIEAGVRLLLMTNAQYGEWTEWYLEDEVGDPSDPLEGFDIKYKREGTGMMDTKYSMLQCRPTKCPKEFRGPYDPEEMVKNVVPTYDKTKEILEKYLGKMGEDSDDDDELDEAPRKKKVSKKKKKSRR